MAACSKDLEEELTQEQSESWECVRTELAEVLAAIATLPAPQPVEAGQIDAGPLSEHVRQLLDDLHHARFVPSEQISEICVQLEAQGYRDLGDKLKRSVDGFDYATARDVVLEIAAVLNFDLEENTDDGSQ